MDPSILVVAAKGESGELVLHEDALIFGEHELHQQLKIAHAAQEAHTVKLFHNFMLSLLENFLLGDSLSLLGMPVTSTSVSPPPLPAQ